MCKYFRLLFYNVDIIISITQKHLRLSIKFTKIASYPYLYIVHVLLIKWFTFLFRFTTSFYSFFFFLNITEKTLNLVIFIYFHNRGTIIQLESILIFNTFVSTWQCGGNIELKLCHTAVQCIHLNRIPIFILFIFFSRYYHNNLRNELYTIKKKKTSNNNNKILCNSCTRY